MSASFRANLMLIYAEMARYRRDGQTDGYSALYTYIVDYAL